MTKGESGTDVSTLLIKTPSYTIEDGVTYTLFEIPAYDLILKRCNLNKDSCGNNQNDYFDISNFKNVEHTIKNRFMTKYFPSPLDPPSMRASVTFNTDNILGHYIPIEIEVNLDSTHFNVPTLTIGDNVISSIDSPVNPESNDGILKMDNYKIHYRDLMFSIIDYTSYELFGVKQIWYDDNVNDPDEEFFFHIKYESIDETYTEFEAKEIIGKLGTALGPKTLFEFKTITKQ